MDSPRFLTQLLKASRVDRSCGKVKMAELSDAVTNRVINGAQSKFTAVDVGDRNPTRKRSNRRREHFVPVSEQQQNVGFKLPIRGCELLNTESNRMGNVFATVAGFGHQHASRDWKAVLLYRLNRVPGLGREMGGGNNQLHLQ